MLPKSEFVLGSWSVSTHGAFFLCGALLCRFLAHRRLDAAGRSLLDDSIAVMVLCSGLGARLAYLLVHPKVWGQMDQWWRFWEGGMISYGGLFGALAALYLNARRRHYDTNTLFSAMAPPILIAWGIGRLGCFLTWQGEEGTATSVIWAVSVGGGHYHPTTLYVSILLAVGGVLLWRFKSTTLAYHALGYYAVVRGLTDNWRVYYPPELRTASQMVCLLLVLFSIRGIWSERKNS